MGFTSMANELAQLYIQTVSLDGEIIPRELFVKTNYIESLNLRAPILMLDLHDFSREYIDNKKINSDSILSITAGDPDGDGEFFKDDFRVIAYPLDNDTIKIQAVSTSAAELLVRSPTAMYLSDTVTSVISKFSTKDKDIEDEGRQVTFHVNNGEKPAYPLMKMAKDNGAFIWASRSSIFFKRYETLSSQPPAFRYEANNPNSEYTITKLSHISNDYIASQTSNMQYMGFNSVEGFQSFGDSESPTVMVSSGDPQTISNLNKTFVPKLDVECTGNPNIFAGMVLEVIVNRYDVENKIDESIPKQMIVGVVAHNENRVTFRTRMILGVIE